MKQVVVIWLLAVVVVVIQVAATWLLAVDVVHAPLALPPLGHVDLRLWLRLAGEGDHVVSPGIDDSCGCGDRKWWGANRRHIEGYY